MEGRMRIESEDCLQRPMPQWQHGDLVDWHESAKCAIIIE